MNKNTIVLLLIFVLPLITYFYVSKSSESNATVSSTVKPKIIKFSSNLCAECQRMEAVVNEVYPKYKENIELISIPVQVQNEYNKDMISKYQVNLVPTIILLNKNQNMVKRIEGYVNSATFESYLKELK